MATAFTSTLSTSADQLHASIVTALENAFLTVTVGQDTSDGSPPFAKQQFPLIADISKVAARVAAFDGAPTPEIGVPYSLTKTDAMRKIIEAIVKETISYIVVNAELAAKERYDKLETDYNDLLEAIRKVLALVAVSVTASAGIPTTVTNVTLASFLAPLVNAGGPSELDLLQDDGTRLTRQTVTTETLINTNEMVLKSDGTKVSVDIK